MGTDGYTKATQGHQIIKLAFDTVFLPTEATKEWNPPAAEVIY